MLYKEVTFWDHECFAIVDDEQACIDSKQEIIRRYLDACVYAKQGRFTAEAVEKIVRIMKELNLTVDDRKVVKAAIDRTNSKGVPSVAFLERKVIYLQLLRRRLLML